MEDEGSINDWVAWEPALRARWGGLSPGQPPAWAGLPTGVRSSALDAG